MLLKKYNNMESIPNLEQLQSRKEIETMMLSNKSEVEREIFATYKEFTQEIDDLTQEVLKLEENQEAQKVLISKIEYLEDELKTFLKNSGSKIDYQGLFEPESKNEA